MVIDIISYTDAQFAALSKEQMLKVCSAQLKKNQLANKLEEDLKKELDNLVKNGTFVSCIWNLLKEKLQEDYEMEVGYIRDKLLYELQKIASDESGGEVVAPYNVDYSLSYDERYIIVRDYYVNSYQNPTERMAAFQADTFAPVYVGDLYSTLYDYLGALTT